MTKFGGFKSFHLRLITLGAISFTLISSTLMAVPTAQATTTQATHIEYRNSTRCFGAAATWTANCNPEGSRLLTSPAFAKKDRPNVYADQCWNFAPFKLRKTCTYGSKRPKIRIALTGNSHAGHWTPAIRPTLSLNKSWQLTTYLLSSCYTVNAPILIYEKSARPQTPRDCANASKWTVNSILKGKYDLVVMSNRTATAPLVGVPAKDQFRVATSLYSKVLTQLTNAGIRVLVIRDTPQMQTRLPECIASNLKNWRACASNASTALESDPLALAASRHRSQLITKSDYSDVFCASGKCRAVIGGVIPLFDGSHMTETFSRSMAPKVRTSMYRARSRGPSIAIADRSFGRVKIRKSKVVKIRVRNNGSSKAKISRIAKRGSGLSILKSGSCKRNKSLSSKKSCTIHVRFKPRRSGNIKAGQVSVAYKRGSGAAIDKGFISGRGYR